MQKLAGKVAIITGASSGQGAAEACLFASEGAKVVITDIDEAGRSVAAELGDNAIFVAHDVGKESGWTTVVATALEHFGRIDILINNAAVYKPASLMQTDMDLWHLHYRVNQLGAFLGMRAVAEPMRRDGGGTIINVASQAALGKTPGIFAYGTSKWALRGMSQLAAVDYAPWNIRVNAIFPGVIDTPMLQVNDSEMLAHISAAIPLGRFGLASEVAQVALFLASDAASYMTGSEVAVNGGL